MADSEALDNASRRTVRRPAGRPPEPITAAAPKKAPEPVATPAAAPAERMRVDAGALTAELDGMSAADFAQMMGGGGLKRLSPGDKVEGTVVRVSREGVFVDIGAKAEGHVSLDAYEPGDEPSVGDTVVAWVLRSDERGVRLASRISSGANLEIIENALESRIPIEGKVESRNKGGFVVKLGTVRAFCPVSQIARLPEADLDAYVGRRISFRVMETGNRDVVVSAREAEEEQALVEAEATWDSLVIDTEVEGTVVASREFGVFVDVGGIRALIPRRELGWDPNSPAPQNGTKIRARVLAIDRPAERLTLSTKDPGSSPWNRVGVDFLEGGDYPAEVIALRDFGALVRLAPGVQGLVPMRFLSKTRVDSVAQVVAVGDKVPVRIMEIDSSRERLVLSMKDAGDPNDTDNTPTPRNARSSGTFGTFASLLGDMKVRKK